MSAMPISTLQNFLNKLADALSGMPEQKEIRDMLEKITKGEGIYSREIFPAIDTILFTHNCLLLTADEVLALRTFDQLEELHRKARKIKNIQSLKTEWENLIS